MTDLEAENKQLRANIAECKQFMTEIAAEIKRLREMLHEANRLLASTRGDRVITEGAFEE